MKSAVFLTILVVLVTSYLPPTSSYITGYDKIFKMFAYQKITDACLGLEIASQWRKDINDAKAQCSITSALEMDTYLRHHATESSIPELPPHPDPSISTAEVVHYDVNKAVQLALDRRFRIFMLTCTMEKIGVINSNGDLEKKRMQDRFEAMSDLNAELKEELKEGVSQCASLASLLKPVDHTGLTIPLKMALVYLSCETKRRMLACMRNDMRNRVGMYDLSGRDTLIADDLISDTPKTEDTDKIMKLFWSSAYQSDDYYDFTAP